MPLPGPITALTQQQLLAVAARVLPEEYLRPMAEAGEGYEVLQMFAKIFARASEAVANLGCDGFFTSARAGARATGEVQLYRSAALTEGVPVEGQGGTAASIIAGAAAGEVRVSGLAGMTSASVGRHLAIEGAASSANNGDFQIAALVDSATVDVANASAVVPDANNGTLSWLESARTIVVKAGSIVSASRGGQRFLLTGDATFSPTATGPVTAPVIAEAMGYEWNLPGQVVTAAGEVLPGEIDTISLLLEEPGFGDLTIQVRQVAATTGGEDAALAGLGADRGLPQLPGESAAAYRRRVRTLPDTVSPGALQRAAAAILLPVAVSYDFIETFDPDYQMCFDAPASSVRFVFDDPDADRYPFRNRWLDEMDMRGAFIFVVSNAQPLRDTSMVYDDPAANAAATLSSESGGQRALTAYDVHAGVGLGYLEGGYDGIDLPKRAIYKGLADTLQAIKGGGTTAAIELKGQ